MNRFIAIALLLLSTGCSNQSSELESEGEITPVHPLEFRPNLANGFSVEEIEPYELGVAIEQIQGNEYLLTFTMNLESGSYYVSPISPGDFSGIFALSFDEHSEIDIVGKMTEDPQSNDTIDVWAGGPVNLVQESTVHTQKVIIQSTKDFKIRGKLQFTIEPRCTLEENWFTIYEKNGIVGIEKTEQN